MQARPHTIFRKSLAEALGTFWLVFVGVGTAVYAGAALGALGIGLAFGLALMAMIYTVGHISGCHLNPAVSVGLVVSGRMPLRELPAYILAQLAGGILASVLLAGLLMNASAESWQAALEGGFGSNGYGAHSPGGFGLGAALGAELLLTAFFVLVIHGATSTQTPAGFAGLAIGLCLTAIHLVALPISGVSLNPARSTASAVIGGDWALAQLWVFWLAPLVGGALGGLVHRAVLAGERAPSYERKVAHREGARAPLPPGPA